MRTIEEIDADIKRLEAERQKVCNIVKTKSRFEQTATFPNLTFMSIFIGTSC